MGLDTEICNDAHGDIVITRDHDIYRELANKISEKTKSKVNRDFSIYLTYKTVQSLFTEIDWSVSSILCDVCYAQSQCPTQNYTTFVAYGDVCMSCRINADCCLYSPSSIYEMNKKLCEQCRSYGYPCDKNTVLCAVRANVNNYPVIQIIKCPKHDHSVDIKRIIDELDYDETLTNESDDGISMIPLLRKKIMDVHAFLPGPHLICATHQALDYLRKCPILHYT
jgi:hypothetical protein